MKKIIKDFYKKNDFVFKFLLCVLVIYSLFTVPNLLNDGLLLIIKNEMFCSVFSDVIYSVLLILVFFKDLKKEFKIFKNDFKKIVISGFKWYFVGICLMVVVNLIISFTLGSISDNETLVREYIFKYPIYALISVMIIAPVSEEIIFRKSLMNVVKNKYLGTLICGLLFGFAHVIGYIDSLIDLVYVLPYAFLGFSFAFMDYENKNTFVSMFYHSIHNTFSFCLILIASNLGVL